MSLARLLAPALLALSFVTLAPAAEPAPARFSKSLPPAEAASTGLTQLDADQLAILDALVRHDVANWDYVTKEPRAPRFSARLSATERHNAGLDLLDDAHLLALDAAVERLMPVAPRGTYAAAVAAAPSTSASSSAAVTSVKINRQPEIHGSASLMVAAGSHGYSAYGGAVEVHYTDPANRFTIGVGYSEIHSKGGYGYGLGPCGRYGGYSRYDDPFFPDFGWW